MHELACTALRQETKTLQDNRILFFASITAYLAAWDVMAASRLPLRRYGTSSHSLTIEQYNLHP